MKSEVNLKVGALGTRQHCPTQDYYNLKKGRDRKSQLQKGGRRRGDLCSVIGILEAGRERFRPGFLRWTGKRVTGVAGGGEK